MIGNPYNSAKFRIGIISAVDMGRHAEIMNSYIETISSILPNAALYPFFVRSMKGDNVTLCVKEALSENFDLILTIGGTSALEVHHQMKKRADKTPWIVTGYRFASTDIPFELYPKSVIINFTLPDLAPFFSQFVLKACEKPITSVLIPIGTMKGSTINPADKQRALIPHIEEFAAKQRSFFAAYNITITLIEYDLLTPETITLLREQVLKNDLVFIPDGILSAHVEQILAEACVRYKKVLCIGSHAAGSNGYASLGYGFKYDQLGILAAQKTYQLLNQKLCTGQVEFITVKEPLEAFANLKAAKDQGLNPYNVEQLCLKIKGKVYENG